MVTNGQVERLFPFTCVCVCTSFSSNITTLCGAISQENCKARQISMQKKKNRDIYEYKGVMSCFITT